MKFPDSFSPSLLDQCIRGCRGKKLAEFLALRPIEVILTQRMMGSRLAAKQLGKILFDYPEMSPTPVDTVVKWVESGVIQVTEAQLREAALASETATNFLALNPWLTDPTGESIPRTKGRKQSAKTIPTVKSPKKRKDDPKASDAPLRSTTVPEPVANSGTEPTQEDNHPTEENKAPKPRRGVKMPPDMTSDDYRAEEPKPLDVKVQGLKEEASE
jgi:hypothetical protein